MLMVNHTNHDDGHCDEIELLCDGKLSRLGLQGQMPNTGIWTRPLWSIVDAPL